MTAVTIVLIFGVPVLSFLASSRFAQVQERKLLVSRRDDGAARRALEVARERRRDMLTDEYARCVAAARRLSRISTIPIGDSDSEMADALLDLESSADIIDLLGPAAVTSALAPVMDHARRLATLHRSGAPFRVLRFAVRDLDQVVEALMHSMRAPAA